MAEAIDKFCRSQEVMDVSGQPNKGVLTGDDMAKWQATVEAPLTYDYGRYTVCKAGPWTQGPVVLQQLALLKGFDLDGMDPTSADFIHLQIECLKLAFADREAFYGDPGVRRRADEDPAVGRLQCRPAQAGRSRHASLEQRPGKVEGYGGVVKLRRADGVAAGRGGERRRRADGRPGRPDHRRHGAFRHHRPRRQHDLGHALGRLAASSPVIPELGFPLGTRGQMFWLEEGLPGSLAPGKRPRTTLTPTLAHRDGEPYMAWGSPGGDQQDQWITQLFLRHVHCGMNLQEAIDAPAWHSEHFPSSFWPRTARPGVLVLEGRVPKANRRRAQEARPRGRGERRLVGGTPDRGDARGSRRKAAANPRGMQNYATGR